MGLSATANATLSEHSGDVWLRRGVAAIVDSTVAVLIAEFLLAALGYKTIFQQGHNVHEAGARALGLVAATLYYPAVMSVTNGRTLGKALMGVGVVRGDRRSMNALRAAWREVIIKVALFGTLASLPIHGPYAALRLVGICVVVLDLLWPLWDVENRALHDFLSGTRVLRIGGAVETQNVANGEG